MIPPVFLYTLAPITITVILHILPPLTLTFSSVNTDYPLSPLAKTNFACAIFHHLSTVHMPFAISPIAPPPSHLITTFLEEVAALITYRGAGLQVLAPQLW